MTTVTTSPPVQVVYVFYQLCSHAASRQYVKDSTDATPYLLDLLHDRNTEVGPRQDYIKGSCMKNICVAGAARVRRDAAADRRDQPRVESEADGGEVPVPQRAVAGDGAEPQPGGAQLGLLPGNARSDTLDWGI